MAAALARPLVKQLRSRAIQELCFPKTTLHALGMVGVPLRLGDFSQQGECVERFESEPSRQRFESQMFRSM